MEERVELRDLVREARVLIGRERARGRARIAVASAPVATTAASVAAPAVASLPASVPIAPREDVSRALSELAAAVAACRACSLCRTRTKTVFADGDPAARLLFVGEAPGRDEDAQGLPFVGRAGQLLNKMIAAIDLKREGVYICNVLKCRPPDNRVPAPDEVERCRPFLEQQIELVKPALICALGLSAAQALLQTKSSMASMRGKTFAFRGVPVIPTYHPAALLRNPGLKREAWVDLQRVRDFLLQPGGGAAPGGTDGN
ncbi:MAG TPA: uracil-DNA glycosylase [Candidatus Eisenbacteria bacterium]|nr:uracil-DNA glycosylase [Candidatus Eisenbacteria bacterium]